jgi:hypothetical protein
MDQIRINASRSFGKGNYWKVATLEGKKQYGRMMEAMTRFLLA